MKLNWLAAKWLHQERPVTGRFVLESVFERVEEMRVAEMQSRITIPKNPPSHVDPLHCPFRVRLGDLLKITSSQAS